MTQLLTKFDTSNYMEWMAALNPNKQVTKL